MHVIDMLVWILGGFAVVVFFYGIVRFVAKAGDQKAHREGYTMIVWGLIALFVLFSLGTILKLLQSDLLSSNSGSATPTTNPATTVCNGSGCGSY